MALYDYRCEADGVFEVSRPLGTAPGTVVCPVCDAEATRVFTTPMLGTTASKALVGAIEHAEKTRDAPDVVTSVPRRPRHQRTPTVPLTPKLARLPRP
jgi:putative FmdB family regulatory protein